MKQKKTRLIALLLGLCLAAGAAGGLTVSAAESGTTVTASKTVSSTGWVIENGKKYYLKSNGKKLLKTGLLKIDGKYYFFNADHSVFVNGWKTIDGKKYFFRASGERYEFTKMRQLKINGKANYYYFNDDHSVAVSSRKTVNGLTYFFTKTGERFEKTGLQKIGKNLCFFNKNHSAAISAWRTVNGNKYYFNTTGRAVSGWKTINKKKYYFYSTNHALFTKSGLRNIAGTIYFFKKDHSVLQSGWKTVGSRKMYFKISGKRYEKTGLRTIYGKKYYFNKDHGALRNAWKKINGKLYYFNSKGVMQTGWRFVNGKLYYFNAKGVMQKSQWKDRAGKRRYYLTSSGAAATGWTKINGYKYYFGSNGVLDEDVRDRVSSNNYKLVVSLKECTVLAVAQDSDGKYTIPAVKFLCSPGNPDTPTPTGTYTAYTSNRWEPLMGPSWGQYGTHITQGIYFHSIACAQKNIYNVPKVGYDHLGVPYSHGCVRLTVRDAKWIFEHASKGIEVNITNSTAKSVISKLKKPTVPPMKEGQTWDPTDPIAIYEQGG